MRQEIIMPRLGQSMDEGRVLRWLISIGNAVHQGAPIAEIETDKAVVEIEAFVTGTLVEIVVNEGEIVPTGTIVAFVDDGQPEVVGVSEPVLTLQEDPSPGMIQVPASSGSDWVEEHTRQRISINASPVAKSMAKEHAINLASVKGSGPNGRIGKNDIEVYLAQQQVKSPTRMNASPAAKRLAEEQDVDLTLVVGTGPAGRIGKDDVDAWLKNQAPVLDGTSSNPPVHAPLSKIKKAIASRMSESKKVVPHFYISTDIELDQALAVRDWYRNEGHEISINDLILKAAAISLPRFPALNAIYAGDEIHKFPNIDLAVAVALDEGLLTPVIHNCEKLSLVEIAKAARGLIERARAGRLVADDLSDGTFTVSNLGMFGVRHFEAIINPPQAAILAVGAIRRVPVYDSFDRLVPRHLVTATVSADHRVTDGAEVARFLQQVRMVLEKGFDLMAPTNDVSKAIFDKSS